jgi:outer membrane protein insertion porin family
VRQANAFGTGKYLSANINYGSVNQVISMSYLNPYWTVDGVSQGFNIYRRKTDASSLAVGPYKMDALGGGITFGYPVSELVAIDFGLNLEQTQLETFDTSPLQYISFVNQFGSQYFYGSLTAGIGRDSRDSILQPHRGSVVRLGSELANGDLQYYKLSYVHSWYYPVSQNVTSLLRADLGYAAGLGGQPLPFFKAYFAGGPDTVRGYRPFSLGPRDIIGNTIGGNRRLIVGSELLFPVPGADKEQSLRLSAFIDGGQVYAEGAKVDLHEMRYAAGIGLSWLSPFGPLKISFSVPLNDKPGDQLQSVQFTFGTGF